MFEWMTQFEGWIALATLISLEVVLGIDNIIFISILAGRLPVNQRNKARQLGIGFAMLSRLALLFSMTWIMSLVHPWFTVFGQAISGRDLILLVGGLFLIGKSTHEIHNSLEFAPENQNVSGKSNLISTVAQITVLDVIFSLDSVITAVGLVEHLSIMVTAIVISVIVMLFAVKTISDFVDANPTIRMLALAFLQLIGVTLLAEAFDVHVPKGYIYFAMAFSVFVEVLNMKLRKNRDKRALHLNKKISMDKVSG